MMKIAMEDHIKKAIKSYEEEGRGFKYGHHRKCGRKKGCPAWNKGLKKGEKRCHF